MSSRWNSSCRWLHTAAQPHLRAPNVCNCPERRANPKIIHNNRSADHFRIRHVSLCSNPHSDMRGKCTYSIWLFGEQALSLNTSQENSVVSTWSTAAWIPFPHHWHIWKAESCARISLVEPTSASYFQTAKTLIAYRRSSLRVKDFLDRLARDLKDLRWCTSFQGALRSFLEVNVELVRVCLLRISLTSWTMRFLFVSLRLWWWLFTTSALLVLLWAFGFR